MDKQHIGGTNTVRIIMLGPSLQRSRGGMATVEKLITQYASPETQIYHISTHEDVSILRKVMVFGRALTKLLWKLLQENVSLVHIHLSERGSALRKAILILVVKAFHRPVILHAHGSQFHLFYFKFPLIAKQLLGWIFRKCSYFIVVSKSWKEFYMANLGLKDEQVVVLTNPIKFPLQVPHRTDSKKINLLFLGRISQRKGASDLIKAFAALPTKQRMQSRLIMAGDGEVKRACRLVRSLNLTDYVTVFDWVDSDQRDALLAKADVFILPSYAEGLPLALLEAMGWGLAVVTTPVGGITELVTDTKTGLLINPGDIKKLSDVMKSLIEDQDLRLALGKNARLRVASLDIKKYWVSLMDIYRLALS